jgi:hypothetical protein
MAKNEEDMPLTMAQPRESRDQYILRKMREEGCKDRLRKATRMAWLTFEYDPFKFRVSIEMLNELDPTQFKDDMMQWLQDLCYNDDLDLNDKTCEEVSDELYLKINEKYPGRTVWIDVGEGLRQHPDNGVLTQYDKRI